MPLKKYLTVFFLSAFLSCGCVSTVSDPLFSNTGPIIDRKGVDLNLYAIDLKQCNEYAAQVSVVYPSPLVENNTRGRDWIAWPGVRADAADC